MPNTPTRGDTLHKKKKPLSHKTDKQISHNIRRPHTLTPDTTLAPYAGEAGSGKQ